MMTDIATCVDGFTFGAFLVCGLLYMYYSYKRRNKFYEHCLSHLDTLTDNTRKDGVYLVVKYMYSKRRFAFGIYDGETAMQAIHKAEKGMAHGNKDRNHSYAIVNVIRIS